MNNTINFQKKYQGYSAAGCVAVFMVMLIPLIILTVLLQYYSPIGFQITLFFTGWFAWTFFEYMMHRYWMHHSKTKKSKNDFNHTHHHSHPADIAITGLQRFILTLIAMLLIAASIWLHNYSTLAAGFLAGLPLYTMMHCLLHQQATQKLFKKLVQYHIYHHCKYPDKCFGVSVTWWDDLCKTVPPGAPTIPQRIIDFYFNHEDKNATHKHVYLNL